MRIMWIIIIILIAVGIFIAHEQQTDFKSIKGIYQFGKTYFRWMGMVIGNVKNVAVSASQMKWTPEVSK